MKKQNSWGQGLNALIPPRPTSSNHQSVKNGLEERIERKVNKAFSNSPHQEKVTSSSEVQSSAGSSSVGAEFLSAEDESLSEESKSLSVEDKFTSEREKIFHVEVDKIKPNPNQPRREFPPETIQELADSIREYGIIEPLVVTRVEREAPHGTKVEYQLVAGERRLRAAQLLGLPTVPVIIKKPLSEERKIELALVENIQREDLSPIARAKAFARLMKEFNLTQQGLSLKIGKSREVIANTLRLLQLPLEAQQLLEEGKLNEGHARAILSFSNPEKRRSFLREILAKNLSGREALLLAQKYLQFTSPKKRISRRKSVSLDPQDIERKEKLENFFQLPVVIKKKGERGEISIKFFSQEELEKILKKILGD